MRFPAGFEWGLAGCLVAAGALVTGLGTVPAPDALATVAASARNPYCTGLLLVLFVVWGESTLRGAAPRSRSWIRVLWLGAAIVLAARFFWVLPEGVTDQWIARMYLSGALAAGIASLALAGFLLVSGLVSPGAWLAATGRWIFVFAPFVIFVLAAGFGNSVIARVRPLADDVRLLRMDESLGFHAAVFFGSFDSVGTWLWDFQYVAYAGIGVLVLAVAGGLFLAEDRAALQRLLRAVIFAGLLGWTGYWLVPAVGPTRAWPELFQGEQAGRSAALAAAVKNGERMPQPAQYPRDCMPSLHTAWALICLFAAWKRRFFVLVLPAAVLSIVTTLTLSMHYTIDVIVAVPFAVFCWWLAAGCRPRERGAGWFLISLLVALAGVAGWAVFAPVPGFVAWGITLFCLLAPAYACLRMHGTPPQQANHHLGAPPKRPLDS